MVYHLSNLQHYLLQSDSSWISKKLVDLLITVNSSSNLREPWITGGGGAGLLLITSSMWYNEAMNRKMPLIKEDMNTPTVVERGL